MPDRIQETTPRIALPALRKATHAWDTPIVREMGIAATGCGSARPAPL